MPSFGKPGRPLSGEATVRAVTVGAESEALRRQLGPTSWMVFEALLMGSTGAGDDCVARVSVRELALLLGLAKDTVAGAVRRLRDHELVTAVQHRTDIGMFDVGVYRITIRENALTVTSAPIDVRSRARVVRRDSSQLSFAIES